MSHRRPLALLAATLALTLGAGAVVSRTKARPGTVTGEVSIEAKGKARRDRGGIVVAIEDVGGKPKAMTATLRQKDKRFDPPLAVVTVGSEVSFPNEDKIFHNVFSVSKAARFDLGLYKKGDAKSVKLKRAGVVDVYCNIHPDMVAKIMVLDTSYYAVTEPDGSFTISGVPAGTYPITAWQPKGDEFRGEVTVTAGGTATVDIALVESSKPAKHTRKDGTPYGRYSE